MSWTTPAQTVNGQTVTAVFWNAQVPLNFDAVFPLEMDATTGNVTLEADSTDPTVSTSQSVEYVIGPLQFLWVRFTTFTNAGSGYYFLTLPNTASAQLTAIDSLTDEGTNVGVGYTELVSDHVGVFLRTTTTVWFKSESSSTDYFDNSTPQVWDSSDTLSAFIQYPIA